MEEERRGSAVSEDEVRRLIARILGIASGATGSRTLADVGVDDDLARFRIWQYAVDAFAERAVADIDVIELLSARTTDDLIEAIVSALAASRHT